MPTLILLPRLHGTADLFDSFRAIIPPHIPTRALCYPTNRPHSHAALFPLLERQLQNETDIILLAESFSGPLALRFAAAHPARVRALILVVSFIAPPVPRLLSIFGAPLALIRFPIPSLAIRIFLAGRRAPPALIHQVRNTIYANRPDVIARRVFEAAFIHAAPTLKKISCPILYLAADRDHLVGRRAARKIRRVRPDITFATIPAPHLLLQLNPAAAWQAITRFLADNHFPLAPNMVQPHHAP